MDCRGFDSSQVPINSSPTPTMGNKIHVLLVEHESIDHDNIINMLRCFSYEVTSVRHAASGLSVLSKEKAQFDLVIANMTSPDSFGYQLMQLALDMNLLIILTSNEEDAVRTMRALEQGAFLCVKKPVTMQVLGYLWQHVSREKVSRMIKHKAAAKQVVNFNPQTLEFGQPNNVMDKKAPDSLLTKRKVWTEWTVDLHTKFMKAARYLGPGRCYPKDILDLMNVPGLTRMQVASHLQKCRNAKWLPPGQRRTKQAYEEVAPPPQPQPQPPRPAAAKRAPRARPISFGSMPYFGDVIQTPPIQNPVDMNSNMNMNMNMMMNLQESSAAAFDPTVEMGYVINPDPYLLNINQDNMINGEFNNMGQGGQLINGAFNNVGQTGQLIDGAFDYMGQEEFVMNESEIYGVAGQASPPTTGVPLNDVTYGINAFGADPTMPHNFSQPELGFDYNGIWQSLVLGQEEIVDINEAPTYVGNEGDQYWTYGGFGSGVNDPETDGGQMF